MFRRLIIAIAMIAAVGVSIRPTGASAAGGWRGGGHYGGVWHRGNPYRGGWRGDHHYRGGWGYYRGGFATGAILGGILAAPYYYGRPYFYADPGFYYSGPLPYEVVQYCRERFKSYDPVSGTYLGYDGYRHSCP